ncbi:MAG: putative photosynthetic complex assembly protein PuhE [Pseudomonadota bacterium]
MMTIGIALLISCFVWWFSTGAILFVVKSADNGPDQAHWNTTLAGLPVLVISLVGLVLTSQDDSTRGVYLAFLSAIGVWGWFELAFLTGVITGPVAKPCPPGVQPLERFLRGWGAVAYSETALICVALVLFILTRDAANPFGLWTYWILLIARMSAKLNLYMGVPNINTEFLPNPVKHLASHFRTAKMNWLFPISVTSLALITGYWIALIWGATDPAEVAGYTLLAALSGLAMIEHWVMVVPVGDAKLWQWMLPNTKAPAPQND